MSATRRMDTIRSKRWHLPLIVTVGLVVTMLSWVTVDAMPFNFDTDDDYSRLNEQRAAAAHKISNRPTQHIKPSAAEEKRPGNARTPTDVHPHGDDSENIEYLKLILMRWLQQSHDLGLIDFKTYLYDILSLEQLDLESLRKELNQWETAEGKQDNKVDLPTLASNSDKKKDKLKSITKASIDDVTKGGLGDELDSEAGNRDGNHKTNTVPKSKPLSRKTKTRAPEKKKHVQPIGGKKHLLEAEQLLASLSELNGKASARSDEHRERALDEEDEHRERALDEEDEHRERALDEEDEHRERSLDEEDENDLLLSSDWSRKREEKSETELKREALLEWLDMSREIEEEY